MRKPWQFNLDMNYDGRFTISDVWGWVVQLYYLPGDSVLYFLIKYFPAIADFFELDSSSYHGIIGGVLSLVVWIILMIIIVGWCAFWVEKITEYLEKRDAREKRKMREKYGYSDYNENEV